MCSEVVEYEYGVDYIPYSVAYQASRYIIYRTRSSARQETVHWSFLYPYAKDGVSPYCIHHRFLPASTKAVMQLMLPDHQNSERRKLNGSDSINAYASPYATRLDVYHRPMPLIVSEGTPAVTARATLIPLHEHHMRG